jgi:parallel beta-helix repeat protein
MKTKLKSILALLLLSAIHAPLSTCLAQGSLTPPGAPAPTMKTLAQIEPRTPVDAAHTPGDASNLFIITNSGSYYLTGNIVGITNMHGISIQADAVTLDLNGFALIGPTHIAYGSYSAEAGIIVPNPQSSIAIRNGILRGCGEFGLNARNAVSSQFDHLRAESNSLVTGGAGDIGIGTGCTVSDCTALGNGYFGFSNSGIDIFYGSGCVINHCTISGNVVGIFGGSGNTFTGCTIQGNSSSGCFVLTNCAFAGCNFQGNGTALAGGSGNAITTCNVQGNAAGISTGAGSTVSGCTVMGNSSYGITAGSGSTISGCTVQQNRGDGIQVSGFCQVLNNTVYANGGGAAGVGGIHITGNGNRIDGNHVMNNANDGILFNTNVAKNILVRNDSSGNGNFQYRFPGASFAFGDNIIGQIYSDATNSQINAWANFSR